MGCHVHNILKIKFNTYIFQFLANFIHVLDISKYCDVIEAVSLSLTLESPEGIF